MLNTTIHASRIAVLAILLTQGQSVLAQQCQNGSCCLKSHQGLNPLTAPTPRRTPMLNLARPQNLDGRYGPGPDRRIPNAPSGNLTQQKLSPAAHDRYLTTRAVAAPVWETDLQKAGRVARDGGQPMLIRITASWCGYCHKMKAETFANPGIQRDLVRGFVTVELDADKNKELVQRLGIQSLPTTIILTPDMQIAERMEGFRTADQLQAKLNRFLPRAELEREVQLALR